MISCGALPAPKHGRKSTFAYTPGTFVKFECDPGYVMTGEDRRWCYASAEWSWGVWGDPVCVRKSIHSFIQVLWLLTWQLITFLKNWITTQMKSNHQLWKVKSRKFSFPKFEAKWWNVHDSPKFVEICVNAKLFFLIWSNVCVCESPKIRSTSTGVRVVFS